jgi:hypothetical protein
VVFRPDGGAAGSAAFTGSAVLAAFAGVALAAFAAVLRGSGAEPPVSDTPTSDTTTSGASGAALVGLAVVLAVVLAALAGAAVALAALAGAALAALAGAAFVPVFPFASEARGLTSVVAPLAAFVALTALAAVVRAGADRVAGLAGASAFADRVARPPFGVLVSGETGLPSLAVGFFDAVDERAPAAGLAVPELTRAPVFSLFVTAWAGMAFFEAFRTASARSAMANPHITKRALGGAPRTPKTARIRNVFPPDKHATQVCPQWPFLYRRGGTFPPNRAAA